MARNELLGGSPHDFVFDLGALPRPGVPACEGLNLRAALESSRSLGSLALEVTRGVVLDLAVDEMEFGGLDDENGEVLERLTALTVEQVVIGSPLGIRAAHQSTQGQLATQLGLAADYRNPSRLRANQIHGLNPSSKSVFIPKVHPVESPVPIAELELGDGGVRPIFNCTRDPAYIRDQAGILHAIRRTPKPIRFSLFKERVGEGQYGIPIKTGYVRGINGTKQLERLPGNAFLLVYSDMLNWLDLFAPSLANRAVCGGKTERDETTQSQLPVIQSLLRYGPRTIRTAHQLKL